MAREMLDEAKGALVAEPDAAVRSRPRVSVIVPTNDRPEALHRCLAALRRQTIGRDLEIIVAVDSARPDRSVAEVLARFPEATALRLGGKGPASARNAGAFAAGGEILLFTDDDCEPCPEWASQLVAATRRAPAVGGSVVNGRASNLFATASQLMTNYLSEYTFAESDEYPFASSNNVACLASVFRKVPFDESFRLAAGEDREWCSRLVASGFRLEAAKGAKVIHYQALSFRRFLNQQLRYGRGSYEFHRASHVTRNRRPWAFYAGLVRAGFNEGFRVGLLTVVAQAVVTIGFVTEALRTRFRTKTDGRTAT